MMPPSPDRKLAVSGRPDWPVFVWAAILERLSPIPGIKKIKISLNINNGEETISL
jgi:hypothetical protein